MVAQGVCAYRHHVLLAISTIFYMSCPLEILHSWLPLLWLQVPDLWDLSTATWSFLFHGSMIPTAINRGSLALTWWEEPSLTITEIMVSFLLSQTQWYWWLMFTLGPSKEHHVLGEFSELKYHTHFSLSISHSFLYHLSGFSTFFSMDHNFLLASEIHARSMSTPSFMVLARVWNTKKIASSQ